MERSRVRRSFEERKGDAAGGEEELALVTLISDYFLSDWERLESGASISSKFFKIPVMKYFNNRSQDIGAGVLYPLSILS